MSGWPPPPTPAPGFRTSGRPSTPPRRRRRRPSLTPSTGSAGRRNTWRSSTACGTPKDGPAALLGVLAARRGGQRHGSHLRPAAVLHGGLRRLFRAVPALCPRLVHDALGGVRHLGTRPGAS